MFDEDATNNTEVNKARADVIFKSGLKAKIKLENYTSQF